MKKLEKREIIILGAMAVVILYGALSFILGGGTKGKSSGPDVLSAAELKTLTENLNMAMTRNVLSPAENYVIARAEAVWRSDPFLEKRTYGDMVKPKEVVKTTISDTEVKKKVIFNYAGYMELSGIQIAIINGAEYQAGEALEAKGYYLKAVYPDKVVIEERTEGTTIDVPIQD